MRVPRGASVRPRACVRPSVCTYTREDVLVYTFVRVRACTSVCLPVRVCGGVPMCVPLWGRACTRLCACTCVPLLCESLLLRPSRSAHRDVCVPLDTCVTHRCVRLRRVTVV